MQEVLTLILGGGRGARLYPLTKRRSEPAVPLAGKYRLIDIPLSNCLNSGLSRIYVLTQFLSVSLHRHIANTYKFDPFSRGFIEVLAAQQTNEGADWYQGIADALRQNLRYVRYHAPHDVLVLSGDQLYRMDFARLIDVHRRRRADVTIAAVPVDATRASGLGVLCAGGDDHVLRLVEKPQGEAELTPLKTPDDWLAAHGVQPRGREYLANMGIYIFRREALLELLQANPTAVDLVRQVLAPALGTQRIQTFLFDGFWEDLGTIKSYHETHLALTADQPPFDFNSLDGPIYTRMRNLPASRLLQARVRRCLLADGCTVLPGADLEQCVLGVRSRVGGNVRLREAIVIGADRFETPEELADNRRRGVPDIGIGADAVIERAIIDKDCRIGRGVRLVNRAGVVSADGELYSIRDGILVIPNDTTLPDGTVI
jgi:glucose-1-phosphate adenylyltransferase